MNNETPNAAGHADQDRYQLRPVIWGSVDAELVKEIRFRVFVDEQKVPAELELDETDSTAFHVLATDKSGEPCGTGRLYVDPENAQHAKIGRMAVLAQHRGGGCGRAILAALIDEARRCGYSVAILSAQTHALPFYEKFGFASDGPEYLDAGIPHRTMLMTL